MNCQIAGVDEAGRGSLAGPVAAAAVILDPIRPIHGLADSKLLSPSRRENLAAQIRQNALAWSVGLIWQERIDQINILAASLEAMAKAVSCLKTRPGKILIDGNQLVPVQTLIKYWKAADPFPKQECLVGGDRLNAAISAASIIAKTFRDRLMTALSRKWPQYDFARHKGYGTREHLAALRQFGSCPLHRQTFRGVKATPVQCELSCSK